jgi:putative CocE/NonD family hydrolase
MLAAMAAPPHLKAIFPYVTASEYYDGWTYQNGALMQWFTSSWTSGLAADTLRRKVSQRARFTDWTWQLPVEDYKLMNLPTPDELAPYFDDWVEHETDDEFWKRWKISDHYSEMDVKGLHGMGWHDIFLKGSIKNFTGLRSGAKTPEARAGQRMLMGPWAHAATSSEGKVGDIVFGEQAVVDMDQVRIDWFDYALKGKENSYATGGPIRLFVMGENAWRDENEWPLARTEYVHYYLHSAKGANSVSGDGTLSTQKPGAEEPDRYSYDPANPVRTIGGRLCCGAAIPPGPFDQRPNEERSDVLVFSTPPLEQDIEVTGHVEVELYAASAARDTDFTAMLVDVDPSGYARFLTDGITRARYRNSSVKAELIEPGKAYKYTIDLWATSNLFRRGHQIRLYISSSNAPRFNRNLNTGEPTFNSSGMVTAQQTIYHDGGHASAVILPVIPR